MPDVVRASRTAEAEAARDGAVARRPGLLRLPSVPLVLGAILLGARPRNAAALTGAILLPLAGYAAWFHAAHGELKLTGYGGQFLYARVAPFADCGELAVPPEQRMLCPRELVGERPTSDEYMWSPTESPLFRIPPEPGSDEPLWARRSEVARDFALRVVLGQAGTHAAGVLGDFEDSFAPTRGQKPGQSPAERWRFRLELLPSERRERIIQENGAGRRPCSPRWPPYSTDTRGSATSPGPCSPFASRWAWPARSRVGAREVAACGTRFPSDGSRARRPPPAARHRGLQLALPALPQLALLPAAGALGLTGLAAAPSVEPEAAPSRAAPPRRGSRLGGAARAAPPLTQPQVDPNDASRASGTTRPYAAETI